MATIAHKLNQLVTKMIWGLDLLLDVNMKEI